jgi:hypothetical protein
LDSTGRNYVLSDGLGAENARQKGDGCLGEMNMVSEEKEQQGTGAPATPVQDRLRGVIRTVRSEDPQSKDSRVKSEWVLLKQRRLLARNLWIRATMRRLWSRGFRVGDRPQTARRLVRLLKSLDIFLRRGRIVAGRPLMRGALTGVAVPQVPPVMLCPVLPAPLRPVESAEAH